MSFPDKIKVSGFPFIMQGWNGVYTKCSETSDGYPVYKLKEYTLYWIVQIAGTRIFRQNGIWRLEREDSLLTEDIVEYGDSPQNTPFGYWSKGIKVEPYD
jgi:hypothetical protein